MNTTLTFEWDLPQGSGPEAIVDYYVISISSTPSNLTSSAVVELYQWNFTVDHNEIYSINITAVNCAGESGTYIFPDFEYSE